MTVGALSCNLLISFKLKYTLVLLKCLGNHGWVDWLGMSDVQDALDEFYKIIIDLYDSIYPVKTITVSNCDPTFVIRYSTNQNHAYAEESLDAWWQNIGC